MSRSARSWTAIVVLAALVVAGVFLVVRGLTMGSAGPPASASQIPAGISTAQPTPSGRPIAAAMAASTPIRIEIPSIGVDAPVMQLGLNADGSIQVPPLSNHNLTGWFDGSVTPGQTGSSIILGHVDNVTGVSVFFYLKTLRPGEVVKVLRADGSTAIFAVDGVQRAVKTDFPTEAVYRNVSYPSLRLITCGGPFDPATGQYLDNIIVYAHLIGS
jgi:sortase (surface protein transpeptidase)